LKVPFRNLLSVSESSPVAGAIKGLNPFQSLDAGRARELQKCAQPATQMLSVHCLYQALGKNARVYFFFGTKVYRDGTRSEHPRKLAGIFRRGPGCKRTGVHGEFTVDVARADEPEQASSLRLTDGLLCRPWGPRLCLVDRTRKPDDQLGSLER